MKQNDYFLNQVENPSFTAYDFNQVGLNTNNTSIETDPNKYKQLKAIQNNPEFQTNGKFDDTKFNQVYNQAMRGYNELANNKFTSNFMTQARFFRDNMFAPQNQKDMGPQYEMEKTMDNPLRKVIGFSGANIEDEPTQSVREIAEQEPFFDFTKQKFGLETPEDTQIKNFFDPKVLATYDQDLDINGNPTTDQSKIVHHKGDSKIDPVTGTYYYETLDGRSMYGKDVLSGWDTLTKEGTTLNKYDFFDSDDLDKSTTGSLVKAAIKIAPAFIPGVAPWYIGTRVILNTMDLMGKLGKMATGSDSPVFSTLEGINQAFTMDTSDHAQSHPWGVENMLNLSSDVFTQLAEQRWIFRQLPKLYTNGIDPFTKEGAAKIYDDATKAVDVKKVKELLSTGEGMERAQNLAEKYNMPLQSIMENTVEQTKLINSLSQQLALEDKQKEFQKLGELVSKVYMTGITVANSYSDAKQAGVDDAKAALFTLGYGVGEYQIINSALGEMILPELRIERSRMKQAAELLANPDFKQPSKFAPKEEKVGWFKKIFNFGKSIANGDYHVMAQKAEQEATTVAKKEGTDVAKKEAAEITKEISKDVVTKPKTLADKVVEKTAKVINKAEDATGNAIANTAKTWMSPDSTGKVFLKQIVANSLGEGTEEASEELLYDMSKTIFNVASWMTGSDDRMDAFDAKNGDLTQIPWMQMLNRYALNFTGGFIGGSLGQGLADYRQASSLKSMDKTQAWQQAVHIIKEGKLNDFVKTINKMQLGSTDLTFKGATMDEEGNIVYKPATKTNNMDTEIKTMLIDELTNAKKILDENSCTIDDQSLLDGLIQSKYLDKFKELRLQDSIAAQSYLQQFNTLATKILDTESKLKELKQPVAASDSQEKTAEKENAEDNSALISQKESELKDLLDKKEEYFNGVQSQEFIKDTLFEVNEAIHHPYTISNALQYIHYKEPGKKIDEITEERKNQLIGEWESIKESGQADHIRQMRLLNDHVTKVMSPTMKTYVANYFQPSSKETFVSQLQNVLVGTFENTLGKDNKLADVELFEGTNGENNPISSRWALAISSLFDGIEQNLHPQRTPESSPEELTTASYIDKFATARQSATIDGFLRLSPNLQLYVINEIRNFNDDIKAKVPEGTNDVTKIDPVKFQEIVKEVATHPEYLAKQFVNSMQELMPLVLQDPKVKDFIISQINKQKFIKYSVIDSLQNDVLKYLPKDSKDYKDYIKALNSVSLSPMEELMDKFSVNLISKSPLEKPSVVLQKLRDMMRNASTTKDIKSFAPDDNFEDAIENTLQLLDIMRSQILQARTDAIDFGNLFGYNKVINEFNKNEELPVIDSKIASNMLAEIRNIQTELEYYRNVLGMISDEGLNVHREFAVKYPSLFYGKLKSFTINIPDDWDKKQELLKVIDDCSVLNTVAETKKYKLSDEDKIELKKEQLNLEVSIKDFFDANKDKDLGEIINAKNFPALIKDNSDLANNTLESISDRTFLWWLSACSAVNQWGFQNEYVKAVKANLKVAPLPAQEMALKLGYSYLLNTAHFQKFAKAYNSAVKETLDNLSEQELNKIKVAENLKGSKDVFPDTQFNILNFWSFLTEGIPGSGKSTAYAGLLMKMIQSHPDASSLLKNVAVIHSSKENAEAYAKDIGLKEGTYKCYDVESYIKENFSVNREAKFSKNSNGYIQIDAKWLQDIDGVTHYSPDFATMKEDIKPPTLIIMDESTRASQQDTLLIQDLQEKYKVPSIMTGDYDQIGAVGQSEIKLNGESGLNMFETHRNNFMGGIKLGTSVRSNNDLKTNNIHKVREQNDNYYKSKDIMAKKPVLNYYSNDDETKGEVGFFGDRIEHTYEGDTVEELNYYQADKVLDRIEIVTDSNGKPKIIKKQPIIGYFNDVITMLNSLDDSELNGKIQVILTDPNTDKANELYKFLDVLKKGAFKNKINFIEGAYQGLEGQYCICFMNYNYDKNVKYPDTQFFVNNSGLKSFYTAISRAQQGSLILTSNLADSDLDVKDADLIDYLYGNQQIDIVTKSVLGVAAAAKYSKEVTSIYDKVLVGHEKELPTYMSLDKPKIESKYTEEEKAEDFKSEEENGDEGTPPEKASQLTISQIKHFALIKNESDSKSYNMLLHSFNANEFGFMSLDADGNVTTDINDPDSRLVSIPEKPGQERYDSLYGLLKNEKIYQQFSKYKGFSKDNNGVITLTGDAKEQAINLLFKLRTSILYSKPGETLQEIQNILYNLGLDSGDIRYGYAYHVRNKKLNDFQNEKLYGIVQKADSKQTDPNIKTIDIVITDKDDKIITSLPLLTITNPYTMLGTEDFKKKQKDSSGNLTIDSIYDEYIKETNAYQSLSAIQRLQIFKLFLDKKIKNNTATELEKNFFKHIQIYAGNFNSIRGTSLQDTTKDKGFISDSRDYYIPINNFNLDKSFRTGIQLSAVKGDKYFLDPNDKNPYLYDGSWVSLNDYKRKFPQRHFSELLTYVDTGINKHDIMYNDGKTTAIKNGSAFVLVSDVLDLSDSSRALQLYLDQIKNPNQTPLITLVYVSSPRATLNQFIYNFTKLWTEDTKNDSSIGNISSTLQIFKRILCNGSKFIQAQDAEKGTDISQKLLDVVANNRDKIQSLVDLLRKVTNRKALSILLTSSINGSNGISKKESIEGIDDALFKSIKALFNGEGEKSEDKITPLYHEKDKSNETLKSLLNRYFRLLVLYKVDDEKLTDINANDFDVTEENPKLKDTDEKGISLEAARLRLEAIEQDLAKPKSGDKPLTDDTGKVGIFYRIPLMPKDTKSGITSKYIVNDKMFVINNVEDNANMKEGPIRINDKLDSTAVITDVSNIFDTILNGLLNDKSKISTIAQYHTGSFTPIANEHKVTIENPIESHINGLSKIGDTIVTDQLRKSAIQFYKDNKDKFVYPDKTEMSGDVINKICEAFMSFRDNNVKFENGILTADISTSHIITVISNGILHTTESWLSTGKTLSIDFNQANPVTTIDGEVVVYENGAFSYETNPAPVPEVTTEQPFGTLNFNDPDIIAKIKNIINDVFKGTIEVDKLDFTKTNDYSDFLEYVLEQINNPDDIDDYNGLRIELYQQISDLIPFSEKHKEILNNIFNNKDFKDLLKRNNMKRTGHDLYDFYQTLNTIKTINGFLLDDPDSKDGKIATNIKQQLDTINKDQDQNSCPIMGQSNNTPTPGGSNNGENDDLPF